MQDQISEIVYYVKGTIKYKWVALWIAWLICLGGWFYIYTLPDMFQSEAKVHVDTRSMLRPLLRGLTVEQDVRVFVSLMQKLMFTRQNLSKIAEIAGIDLNNKSEIEKMSEINGLKEAIKISGGSNDLFSISYESFEASRSKSVVQAVLTVFSDQTQSRTLGNADSALRFLEEQIQEYEMRLRSAEKARENFKRMNFGLLPGDGNQLGQLQELSRQIDDAKLLYRESISRRDVLQEQLEEGIESEDEWGITDESLDTGSIEDARIEELIDRRNELLLRYTEHHPSVSIIDSTIMLLQEQAEDNAKTIDEDADGAGSDFAGAMENPYVQSLKSALNAAEAQAAAAQSRVDLLEQRLEKSKKDLDRRLSVESEMQDLNRDYNAIKSNFNQLIQSREKALISEKADSQAASLNFKIVEPPTHPLEPTSPNRILLLSIITVGSLLIGFGCAFLIYFVTPTFMSLKQLRSMTGLPVLGEVSLLYSDAYDDGEKKLRLFYVVTLSLFLSYFSLVGMQVLKSNQINVSGELQRLFWKSQGG